MTKTLTTEEVTRDLAFAIEAARWAGRRAMGLRESGRWKDAMLADIGDQAADGLLQGLVRGRYPDDGLLSEETADSKERLSKPRAWIIDPLDGTKEFSQVRHDFAVHVALTVDGRPALGAVALPALDQVLWAVCVEGSMRAGNEGGGALTLGDSPSPGAPKIVVSRSHTPEWTGRFCEELGVKEQVPLGSVGFKVSRLFAGEADVYVHKKGLKEWDTCAPEVVARALGWTVCKLRGEDHRYNQTDPKNHELVVCRPAWKERVIAALASSGALVA
ncbi:MAG: 3'(2'),5'-bisphosphate nucleotidase CysQ [Planctomycetes bacterium]|nr:3'(2'),5'-bisphosphate nucleotidase CysQ [Planctomycetota bacterium]